MHLNFARKLRPLFSTTPTGVHNNCIASAPCRSSPIGIGSEMGLGWLWNGHARVGPCVADDEMIATRNPCPFPQSSHWARECHDLRAISCFAQLKPAVAENGAA